MGPALDGKVLVESLVPRETLNFEKGEILSSLNIFVGMGFVRGFGLACAALTDRGSDSEGPSVPTIFRLGMRLPSMHAAHVVTCGLQT